ncbi:hypothetical protein EWM64_g5495 [Hericium alpestre]|uniref:Guanylate-binding protein N-terminal domain-containing protein n=1 Tax=Hericium alpestre TaxID=135208 RepID=A0A4Y9ZYM6_9AGAM|nr:hypothetical protein EWM64_g5495 [Hericium alpestre]
MVGSRESTLDAAVEFTVYQLQLTTEHRHNLQLDPTFIPTPTINQYNKYAFRLPLSYRIRLAQLLENDKMLLILDDGSGKISVYLESLATLDGAIGRQKVKKTLHQEKIGRDFSFAFDETKRMLAVCSSSQLCLYIYVFDAAFTSLSGLGTILNLVTWFTPGTAILHACFVSGEEEILLIDSMGQARIFSLITEQFRPAFVQLDSLPQSAFSSPDGSCLLISYQGDARTNFVAYHWSTFGSTNGIPLLLPDLAGSPTVLSSIGNRNSIHLMSIDMPTHSCRSTVLDIKRKVTEFMFREKGAKQTTSSDDAQTMHNCLIDCFCDLWTRFPVVPAIRRRTITSSSIRVSKRLKLVTESDHRRFSPYFNDMIQAFEKLTRKPTASELRNISVSGSTLTSFESEVRPDIEWDVSRICLGEWLADFLCLIPIQIAVCRENRFIPLKDGVFSPELERSLLGAEVTRIVDNISLGWYESLLQSYMVSKPVKVVSSMGEQSVGKSYALNHLVDTSFAGSAMRTTEGVWMSITPTDDAIVVALDFEGVHSIERSTQEDTLLVLFNTAISNLDVVDSDKLEVQREFALKFQKIVQDEQDANFISRLHAGNLNIIPWPVIESPEFYKLFQVLKKRLDQQVTKHRTAGEFLFTLKTLMAKLKANDWGALSQTLVAHRAQALLAILPMALKTGCSEVDPDIEPLKNFDTDLPVDNLTDSSSHFYLAGPAINADVISLERTLHVLRAGWEQFGQRQQLSDIEWVAGLSLHLERIVELRQIMQALRSSEEFLTALRSNYGQTCSFAKSNALAASSSASKVGPMRDLMTAQRGRIAASMTAAFV